MNNAILQNQKEKLAKLKEEDNVLSHYMLEE